VNPVGPKTFERGAVRIVSGRTAPDNKVEITLTDLAARRLVLALGVNTARYGPEMKALLDGLAKLLFGIPSSGLESSHPHGPGHPCGHCRKVFDARRQT